MKIFRKERFSNGRYCIYFCGIKVFNRKKYIPESLVSCDIYNYKELVKQGTIFPHLLGIVISKYAVLGKNCVVYQNVTIGTKHKQNTNKNDYPKIGDNVIIYAGAVIVGPIKIGNNVVIGANSLVLQDVPDNCVVAGIPAKIISRKQD